MGAKAECRRATRVWIRALPKSGAASVVTPNTHTHTTPIQHRGKHMKRFTLAVALATTIGVLALAMAPAAYAKPPTVTNVGTVPITGTSPGGSFTGTYNVTSFT